MSRIVLSVFFAIYALASTAGPVEDMLRRVLPAKGDAKKFDCRLMKKSSKTAASFTDADNVTSRFTLSCDGKRIRVRGTDNVALAAGANWFLQHYAGVDISWNSPTAKLPDVLPVVAEETHTSSVDYRYYLNFCTHSYSMAFWDWERWQQEIDWMALHGINLPLIITGMECVWRDVLERGYGYQGLDGVNRFVTGSAYYGWFFMNNMTAWGGPQPEMWYASRLELARRIFRRLRDFGMKPVIPGYVGMVPSDFLTYASRDKVGEWTAQDIVNGGMWCSFERPYFVNNTERLKEFAANYYASIDRLFGDVLTTHFYAIDPFHEGGVPRGVTSASASVRAMYDALISYDEKAVWVCQHWQNNPTTTLTHAIPAGRLLILDLHGDDNGDTTCSGNHTTADGKNHRWVWGQVSNFGGNVGLFGRIDRLINCFYSARNTAAENGLCGIGALPEGIENNSMLYDLLYALPWTNVDYTRQTWLQDYVGMRYGVKPGTPEYVTLLSAWQRLMGIYNCPNDRQQGTTESVFLMRPALQPRTVSSWANSTWYWNMDDIRQATREMLSLSDILRNNDNYRYDLVDLTRQALADLGKTILDSIAATEGSRRAAWQERFLDMILDQDRLLATRDEFRLSRWTEAARAIGQTTEEKALYEKNARMLLTTWGDRPQCERGGLHDYANREWSGLLSSFYYPRWKAYFVKGSSAQFNWFDDFEWPFVMGTSPSGYATFLTPAADTVEDAVAVAHELYHKYLQCK